MKKRWGGAFPGHFMDPPQDGFEAIYNFNINQLTFIPPKAHFPVKNKNKNKVKKRLPEQGRGHTVPEGPLWRMTCGEVDPLHLQA